MLTTTASWGAEAEVSGLHTETAAWHLEAVARVAVAATRPCRSIVLLMKDYDLVRLPIVHRSEVVGRIVSGQRPRVLEVALVLASGVGLALVAYLLIKLAPHWLTDTGGLDPAQRDAALGRARTALLALLAGTIAVVGALYTARAFALNRRGQITERFSRAIEHLADERTAVRLGGIYAFERIAHESADEHGPTLEVLTAYVRQNSAWPTPAAPGEPPAPNAELGPPQASVEIKQS
jgi:hypothetical protein